MKRLNQTGSHIAGILLFALVIGVVVFAGWKVEQARAPKPAQVVSSKAAVPDTITTTKDLQDTSTVLDNESSQLDSGLDSSTMDSDLNSML
ncbi:MAG TPA: hypothetical protein VLF40_01200 [Candidatus Saccharimonadales bacterium]|nr:hypothetical protein [Candidatus Saccharimonadales bacterium]